MSVAEQSSFSNVIEEHLNLKRKNSRLEPEMPLARYRGEDPYENHPLFKTEEEARIEETMSGVEPEIGSELPAPIIEDEEATQEAAAPDDTLWGRSRDFDWGD